MTYPTDAPFKRGDLVETKDEGGLGIVLNVRSYGGVELDWILFPIVTPFRWEARDIHPDFDLVCSPNLLRKIGELDERISQG